MRSTILFALASFVWPAVAGAGPLCAPLASLHSSIKFCEENPRYLPPAAACRDEYRALVAKKSAEVRWLLAGQVARSTEHAQSLKLANTQDVYTSAENLLTALISQGRQVKAEIEGYADDFVPPIPSWGAGHWKPDRRNPNDPARSLDYYCWAEPMGDMDLIIADVEKMLKELEATKAKTVQLHGVTDTRHGNLEDMHGRQRDTVGVGSGQSPQEASTVTGKIRNDSLASVAGRAGISAPTFESGEPDTMARLTASGRAEDPWAASKDSFSTISGKSPLPAQAGTSLKSGKEAEAPRSLGAALWAEPTAIGPGSTALVGGGQEPSKALSLATAERAPASFQVAAPLPHGEVTVSASGSQSETARKEGVRSLPAIAQAGQALVSHETTLFAAVSRCYRKTSLFRQRF